MRRGDIVNYLTKANPDVLCLNEIKIDAAKLALEKSLELIPSEYSHYYNCCKTKAGYSGTGVFTKHKPISVKYDLGVPQHDNEGRAITLEFEKFYLVNCYVPNAGEGLKRLKYRTEEWDPALREYVKELKGKKNVVLCGDLNVAHREIDIHDPKGHYNTPCFTLEERGNFSRLLDNGFVDTFRQFYPDQVKYSYFSKRGKGRLKMVGWRLDYFVVNHEFRHVVKDSIIDNDSLGSDHCPVELLLDLAEVDGMENSKKQKEEKI